VLRAGAPGLDALALVPDLLARMQWREAAMRAALEPSMYATDLAIDLAREGMPFRDAYRQAADPARWSAGDPEASLAARVSAGAAGDLRLETLRTRCERIDANGAVAPTSPE
jgi:argininosuccinate lyase